MHEQEVSTGEAGFTLIETMIAMVVLTFGLMGVVNLFLMASQSNFSASQTTAAANLASEQIDVLRTVPYTALAIGGTLGSEPGGGNDDPYTPPVGEPGCPGGAANHSCTQIVPGIGQIQVSWKVEAVGANTLGITVEALPASGLARGWSRVRLTTIRTCTIPAPGPGIAGPCPEILAP